jgi:hypothetical protein
VLDDIHISLYIRMSCMTWRDISIYLSINRYLFIYNVEGMYGTKEKQHPRSVVSLSFLPVVPIDLRKQI